MSRTLDQERALHALRFIENVDQAGKFVSHIKSLPAAILMNGLGQAAAMEKSGDPDHKRLFQALADWLRHPEHGVYRGQTDLMAAIVSGSQEEYVRAQAEALAYLGWLKKFAVAYLGEDNHAAALR